MSPTKILTIVLFAGAVLSSGCATSRGLVSLTTPTSDKVATSKGIEVYIGTVADKRVFEVDPKSPEIPSLHPSEPQSDQIKARAVARKRNTFGKGLGDILLKEDQTVASVITDSLRQAFKEEGYTVVSDRPGQGKNVRVVDVEINKFWSWMNPGFWAITLSTEIGTDIIVRDDGKAEKKTVYVQSRRSFSNCHRWKLAGGDAPALKQYVEEVKARIK